MTGTPQQPTPASAAREWLTRQYGSAPVHTLAELTEFLTTFSERVRGEAIEECAQVAEAVGREWRLGGNAYDVCGFTAAAIRSKLVSSPPTTEPTRTMDENGV